MLSRIADSLFWTNRYMERADGMLRCTMTNYILMFDKGVSNNLSWQHILEVFAEVEDDEIETIKFNTEASLQKILLDTTNINSLKKVLGNARENARGIQDNITKEVWEQVNGMYHSINAPQLVDKLKGYDALETVNMFCKESIMYNGVTDTTMQKKIFYNGGLCCWHCLAMNYI